MGDYAYHKDRIIRNQYQSPGFFYAGDYANHNDLTNRGVYSSGHYNTERLDNKEINLILIKTCLQYGAKSIIKSLLILRIYRGQ